jgi:feruloyl-CoA synthase
MTTTQKWEEAVQRRGGENGARFRPQRVEVERRADGTLILRAPHGFGEVAPSVGAWLNRWAHAAPDRVAVAERSGAGWRALTYAELLQQVRAVGAALIGRGLAPGGRIVFLSGNGVDHLILSLAAQYVGAVAVPVAEQYGRMPERAERLAGVLAKVRPQMAFVAKAVPFARALATPELDGVEIVAVDGEGAGRPVTAFDILLAGDAAADVDAAHAAVGHDTVGKILFTSGSSSAPKGVVTTHGMMCVNQAQVAAAWPFLADRPPRLLDWLPWNHVFGGSKNLNLVLSLGGSLYIDDGRPTPAGFARTCENILAHAGTVSFNVPVAYSLLVAAAEKDKALRRRFFEDLDLLFYAGASMAAPVWEKLEQYCLEEGGQLPLMASSWGMTETAPSCVMVHEPVGRSGNIGVPLPGVEVKLVPDAEMRCEMRVRGPNVMAGYLDDPERTAAAFDAEGYLLTGDAVRFADPQDPSRGLVFDGRVGETSSSAPAPGCTSAACVSTSCARCAASPPTPSSAGTTGRRSASSSSRTVRSWKASRQRTARSSMPACSGLSPSASLSSTPRRPARRAASPARSCFPSRRRSPATRSPTRDRSTSRTC